MGNTRTTGIVASPSIACGNWLNFQVELDALVFAGAQVLHLDVMDNHYVPNLALSWSHIQAIAQYVSVPLDIHLMVEDPEFALTQIRGSHINSVIFHQDSCRFPFRLIHKIRDRSVKAGLALNPADTLSSIREVMAEVDYVLVMSVEPGFNGQKFIASTLEKVRYLAELRRQADYKFQIMVDGGIDKENALLCASSGADVVVAGLQACYRQNEELGQAFGHFVEALQTRL